MTFIEVSSNRFISIPRLIIGSCLLVYLQSGRTACGLKAASYLQPLWSRIPLSLLLESFLSAIGGCCQAALMELDDSPIMSRDLLFQVIDLGPLKSFTSLLPPCSSSIPLTQPLPLRWLAYDMKRHVRPCYLVAVPHGECSCPLQRSIKRIRFVQKCVKRYL
jgi:hypothetical protein